MSEENLNAGWSLNEYQAKALVTKKPQANIVYRYSDITEIPMPWVYAALKLAGEAGEVAEKFGKLVRDKHGVIDNTQRVELLKELGDVLWYISSLADDLGADLNEVAQMNIAKLSDRATRGVIHGSGDNR